MSFSKTLYRNANRNNILMSAYPQGDAPIPTALLSDFEGISAVPKVPFKTQTEDLWSHYGGDPNHVSGHPDTGVVSISDERALSGSQSLKIEMSDGNIYTQFYPNDTSEWFYAREVYEQLSGNPWELNTYDGLKIWMFVPAQMSVRTNGTQNIAVGTYYRGLSGARSSAEGGGGDHGYHYFLLNDYGCWVQLVLDMHPSHLRTASNGGIEQPVMNEPTGDTGFNYFDVLTRFYFDGNDLIDSGDNYPHSFYIDSVEFFKHGQDVSQIYNVYLSFKPSTNTLHVTWNRNKNENALTHEIRYSFSPISSFDDAVTLPNGVITPPGYQGYNMMFYSTDTIDVTGRSEIYVAIKADGASAFRTFTVPVTGVE